MPDGHQMQSDRTNNIKVIQANAFNLNVWYEQLQRVIDVEVAARRFTFSRVPVCDSE